MTRSRPALLAAVLGLGLALAPVAFQMFDRAPKGGDMIDEFQPYMTDEEIGEFRRHLSTIGAAQGEAARLPADRLGDGAASRFVREWPAIDDDMGSMLRTMEDNIGRYDGVAALPPFPLFPWFFVIPGVLAAAVALFARRPAAGLAALGVGLLLAPAAFQMFSRTPGGAAMIDDFRPLMTDTKVTRIQGYFLTIGVAEAELRRDIVPAAAAGELPAVVRLTERWPAISADMAPMIGAMADNVDNFAAVDALPPFWLFPWFFVAPGVLLLAVALALRRRPSRRSDDLDTRRQPLARSVTALVLVAVALAGCGGDDEPDESASAGDRRTGVLEVDAGACTGDEPTGSWFRMVQPGGTPEDGPYVDNGDSSCADKTVTPLSPGTDGGLRIGDYQPQPEPPFGDGGASRSAAVIEPAAFFAVPFGISTNATDPQTGRKVPAPTLSVDGDDVRADLSALSVSWNGQHFNQGAPKPGGEGSATGTFDESTGRYTLDWTSLIEGGPFNGFVGVWHFEGMFRTS